ncbi:MAG: HEAT repeat domain-containing protein [Cyanobacteria bacterium]|nr:HEAT repeat domain-containing protein [Cyanobacteriota bacterium]
MTTDRHLKVRGWNAWVTEAIGVPDDAVIGRSLLDFVAAERVDFYRDLLSDVIASGSARVLAPAFHRYLIRCPPRTRSDHFDHMQQRVTIAPLVTESEVVGLMITLEDVTGRLDRERSVAAILDPCDATQRTEALASEDWQVRGQAIRHLRQSASADELRYLFETLHRDHHDLNVLNSALRVLIGAGRAVVEPLVQLLSDQAANLRMHAALALGELKAQEATPTLVTTLEDPDENVRFHAIEALGRIGATESIGPLSKIAASGHFFLAFAAIDALGKTEDARVAPLMVSLLDQELLRPAAIATLALIGDEDCVPALARALNADTGDTGPIAGAIWRIYQRYDESLNAGDFIRDAARNAINTTGRGRLIDAAGHADEHRYAAATVLSWLGEPALGPLMALLGDEQLHAATADGVVKIGAAAVEPLIAALESAARPARIAAAQLLGRLGDRRATAALLRALDDAESDVAAAAAAALGGLGDPAALTGLIGLFGHPSATVRRAAIAAINATGAAGTAGPVRAAMTDVDPRVRESAIRVAGYFGFNDAVPGIVAALADAVEDVRRAAIEQLPVLDGVDAAGKLAALVAEETPRNRAAAAHALRLIDDPRAGAALRDALQDEDAWVRYFAATSLPQRPSGSIHAQPLATLAQNDPATHVRIAAITSLGALDQQLAARAAAALIDDDDDDLAVAAIKVLGTISRPEAFSLLERAARAARPALQLAAVRAFAGRPSLESIEVLAWAARVSDVQALSDEAIEALRRIGAAADQPIAQRAAVAALRELAAEGTRRLQVIAAIARLPCRRSRRV